MTVKQLIDHLCTCNPEALIVLSSDSEGNDYRPLAEISTDEICISFEFSTSVEVYESSSLELNGIDEDDERAKPCITLWPTN